MNYTQCGSALALPYADGIAQTCVTSPPYYGLRDYGTAGQIGLEQTPAAYVGQIVAAMREVWRVLRDDGTLWLNLGDSYANDGKWGGSTGGKHVSALHGEPIGRGKRYTGLKPKDLMGIPWRVAFALQDDGWYLRSDIIWAKPNPMPESVTDRPTKAHEYVFLLAKRPRYYYDAEAIKGQQAGASAERARYGWDGRTDDGSNGARTGAGIRKMAESGMSMGEAGPIPLDGKRNARSVWQIATTPYAGAHFATMPPELARRCILAGSSARGQCPKCGSPWVRVIERTDKEDTSARGSTFDGGKTGARDNGDRTQKGPRYTKEATGWAASCECEAGDPVLPQIVLDPFMGSGTTAMVALQNGRQAIGTELNPAYMRLQDDRTEITIGLGL